jgi:hypothetical protein
MAFPIDALIAHPGHTHCGQAFPHDIAEKKCGKRAKKRLAKTEFGRLSIRNGCREPAFDRDGAKAPLPLVMMLCAIIGFVAVLLLLRRA